jgi:3-phenylpropionate/cinnamic acid dioxygenase small subunit
MSALPDAAMAAGLLYREAHCLDAQRWDDWLALYCEDAVFWIPAWKGEHELTAAPDTEVSLVYAQARAGLEDRVWRVRSGLSAASALLPRTSHAVNNVLVEAHADGAVAVLSSFACHVYDLRRGDQHVFFGRYEHTLRQVAGEWKIARKKVVLMNDRIPTMIDFYSV